MPQYLRTSSVRLIEASQEALALAFVGLGLPARQELRVGAAQFAASAGLIGVAVEQALSAILVQVLGEDALMASRTQFKSAREVLQDVRSLLVTPPPRASFLTYGLLDAAAHRQELHRATEGFTLIIGERAAGLHAGQGPSRAVAMVQAQKVLVFYNLLARSSRIRPYLEQRPRPPESRLDTDVIVDDLARRFTEAETLGERSATLRSLFLVLPEVPAVVPEWLDAFDRSAVAPTSDDINLLLQTLEHAAPVRFHRLNAGGQGLPVAVRPDDANALPIAPHHLRRAFGDVLGQFDAYVGTANGRLNDGHLDVPPESFLLDLWVLGPNKLIQELNRERLTAHDAWPFIVTALSSPRINRPFWFLVSMVDDLGQLVAQLHRAFDVGGGGNLRQQQAPTLEAIDALRRGQVLAPDNPIVTTLRGAYAEASARREALASAIERNRGTPRNAGPEAEAVLRRVSEGEWVAGQAFETVMGLPNQEAKRYWSRLLAESASDPEDREMLVRIHRDDNLVPAQSAARKAMKLIDAVSYGPQVELE
ncbi:hypothetical protein [Comamonas terrigena]|uniref:hypothetical protein n=1 Tax=Comamonas terrigena TaxID=32013 RepID=UPI00244BCAC1|nr:hypothetical protein [Comamonas terrigena]MDH1700546.1 hypothetical protein [Comamonas terrigena]